MYLVRSWGQDLHNDKNKGHVSTLESHLYNAIYVYLAFEVRSNNEWLDEMKGEFNRDKERVEGRKR